MAIVHEFLTVGGREKRTSLTPIKAIKENCVQCVQSRQIERIKHCDTPHCPLYPFRLGQAHRDGKA